MAFLKKLFTGKSRPPEVDLPDNAQTIRSMEELLVQCKSVVADAIVARLKPRLGQVRADRFTILAVEHAMREPHDDRDVWDGLSRDDWAIIQQEGDWAANNPDLAPAVADACWWIAQIKVLQAWDRKQGPISESAMQNAVQTLYNAIAIGGEDPRYLRTMAWAYLTGEHPQEAYDFASAAIAAEQDNLEGWRLKGNSAYFLGLLREAEYCFSTALRLAPGNPLLVASLNEVRAAIKTSR